MLPNRFFMKGIVFFLSFFSVYHTIKKEKKEEKKRERERPTPFTKSGYSI